MPIKPTPKIGPVRYLMVTKPLDRKVAEANRTEHIRLLEAEIKEKLEDIKQLQRQPIPTTTEEYVEVHPDDPRWSEASDKFDPKQYTGKWKFTTEIVKPNTTIDLIGTYGGKVTTTVYKP